MKKKKCFLVLAYGGPRSEDEIEGFLSNIFPDGIPKGVLESAKRRYAAIGGSSPICHDVSALSSRLKERLDGFDVDHAFRFSDPKIADVVSEKLTAGFKEIYLFLSAPFYSEWSYRGYLKPVAEAVNQIGASDVSILHSRNIFLDGDFVDSWIFEIKREGEGKRFDEIIFTAHSLPLSDEAAKETYPAELEAFAREVSSRLGVSKFRTAFQSGGSRTGEWLGPDVSKVVESLEPGSRILVIPAGFLQENVETLYDLDIELKGICLKKGIEYARAKTPFNNEPFLKFLSALPFKREFWSEFKGRGFNER